MGNWRGQKSAQQKSDLHQRRSKVESTQQIPRLQGMCHLLSIYLQAEGLDLDSDAGTSTNWAGGLMSSSSSFLSFKMAIKHHLGLVCM